MLTKRQGAILKIIVGDYIASGVPVSSQSIASRRELGVSSATVRNEMADLEGSGYIVRRHISAGGIPVTKGYRHYVSNMPVSPVLAGIEARRIYQEVQQAMEDVEAWSEITADLLASLVSNVAVVSPPRASTTRLKRLDLVLLQETLALLVLVLQQAKTRKRILHLETAASQEELTKLANRLTALYGGSTSRALLTATAEASLLEQQVLSAARDLLTEEETGKLEEPVVHGVRYFLGHPEFVEGSKVSGLIDLLEDRKFLREFLPRLVAQDQVRIVIGEENEADELRECSIVVSRYGAPETAGGYLAVIGPTRMPYDRSIASVQVLASAMSDLVATLS